MTESTKKETQFITMFGSPTCPQVRPCRGILNRAGAKFEYVDISKDVNGRETVRSINNGFESVPTLIFPDGSTLTEPSGTQLKTKLAELGYQSSKPNPWELFSERPFFVVMALLALLFGIYDGNPVFLGISLLIFGYIIIGGWLQS